MKRLRKLIIAGAISLLSAGTGNAVAGDDFWYHVTKRIAKEYQAKEWQELPDEALIPASKIKWNRLAKAALNLPDWMEFSLSQRTRFESVSHPWRRGQTGGTDAQLALQSRIHAGVNHGPFWLMFEGQDSRTHFAENHDFNGNTVTDTFDILQLFGSATFRNINDTGLRADFHVGRITLQVGSGRLVGRNGFRNTTNSFDGAQLAVGNDKKWRIRAFLTAPVLIDPTELDESSHKRLFWGGAFESTQMPWLNGEAYYFGLNDQRNADQSKNTSFSTLGARAYKSPAKSTRFVKRDFGKMDYEFEFAVQTGDKGAKDFFAYMGHAELGYTVKMPWYPRFNGEYDYASGTRDPSGSNHHTFDRLFGLRRSDLMQTGIFGPFFRSNIESAGSRFSVQPRDDLKVFMKHHVWYLAEAKDALAGSNLTGNALQDSTGRSGRFLGHDLELVASWKLKNNLIVEAGYEHWFKGDYFKRLPTSAGLPAGGQKDSDYFFVSSELRF